MAKKCSCEKCKQKEGGSFVNGVLFGALVGTIAGILVAPDAGKNTQKKLKVVSKKAKKDVDPILEDLKPIIEKMAVASEPVRKEMTDAISQLIENPKENGKEEKINGKKKKAKKTFFKN